MRWGGGNKLTKKIKRIEELEEVIFLVLQTESSTHLRRENLNGLINYKINIKIIGDYHHRQTKGIDNAE